MKTYKNQIFILLFAVAVMFINFQNATAQRTTATAANAVEEYTGTVISFNGPRTQTAFFTLRINSLTSDEQATANLATLRDKGQRELLDQIDNENVGSFSIGNNVARPINVVRESTIDGKRRIFAVFQRETSFAELRGGYRSVDYPFGVIEILVDPQTGKGDGTFIAAARIRFDEDNKTNQRTVEIENFGTYPAKLTRVTRRETRRRP